MTFEEWKAECAVLAEQLLGLGDVLAKDDPYEVAGLMPGAFKIGKAPEAFIRDVFEEDFARMGYDEHLAEEALAYEDRPEE